MASLFRVRRNSNNESAGGKLLRGRRIVSYSPYARPSSATDAAAASSSTPYAAENTVKSSWFSGFVNGAGKIVSTVFGSSLTSSDNDSDDDEEEEEDNDSINEGDSDDNNDHNSQGSNGINKTIESYGTKYPETQPLAVVERSEAKLQIERLLMQKTFTRDECNRLTNIIQSRVVESHASREGGNASEGVDSLSTGPLARHHAAIMEAKKWLEEKKYASSLKLESSPLALATSPFKNSNVTDGDVGSPVLMAKTYMRSRPPWASPSSSHVGFRTPSPIRMHLLKEETPIGGRSMSASKFIRRSPIVNDSQEILAELRRVRLKSEEATMIMENDGVVNETTSLVRADQDLEDPRFKESVEGSARVNNTSEVMETEYTDDSRRPVGLNPSKEINGTTDRVTSNGGPPSASSLSAGLNVGPENEGSSESRLGIGLIPLEEETCEPSSEAAVQIPDDGDEEIDGGAIGPETSSSGHSIEFEPTSRKSNSTLVGKQPQEEKKSGKSSRRGRGRGKSQA